MTTELRKIILNYPWLYRIIASLYHRYLVWKSVRKCRIKINCYGTIKKDIIGKDNTIIIGRNSRLKNLIVRIRGNNNNLSINEDCVFGPSCSIWIEGNNSSIQIARGCTFTAHCHLNAQEEFSQIIIGEDCMFSNHIIVRTSDSHPIYDINTKKRINEPKPVKIGNHVWIAPNTKIMKGAEIPDGCIVGSDTTITKKFSHSNSLIVGRPASVVKEKIIWTRDQLF